MKFKKGKSSTESHWLDHAVSTGKFERPFVQDIKALGKLLVLYLPLPMFWALLEQQVCYSCKNAIVTSFV